MKTYGKEYQLEIEWDLTDMSTGQSVWKATSFIAHDPADAINSESEHKLAHKLTQDLVSALKRQHAFPTD
jgi:hypothetical protein